MLILSEDDDRSPPLLVKWSQSAGWIYDLLNDKEIAANLPQDVKEKGWKLIQEYEKFTSLM